MTLTKEQIQDFKIILEKEKGEEVSWDEASEGARNLYGLFRILYDVNRRNHEIQ